MRQLRAWIVRLGGLLRGGQRDRDFADELESHIQMHTDDNVRAGMPPADARRAAVLRVGGLQAVREARRDRSGVPLLQNLGRDVRYALRLLRRTPAFTTVTVVTLALGIGANTAIFTLVNAFLLRPVPYEQSGRLMMLWGTDAPVGGSGGREQSVSYPDFEAWRDGARSVEAMAAFTTRPATLGGSDQPELVPAVQTTARFFDVLRIRPLAGRAFSAADEASDAQRVAVLSDAAWKRQFGGRADILGRTVAVNRIPHVVIGIVPSDMHFIPTEAEQVYTLLPRETNRARLYLRVVARLKPDVAPDAAQAELDVIARALAAEFPATNANRGGRLTTLAETIGAPVRQVLLIMLGLVGAVLLIACTNVANLLLARNASRQHELALRASLGAGRGRILQQLLTECLVLALAGGAAGLLVGKLLIDGLVALLGDGVPVPRLEAVRMDTNVLLFCLAVSVVTGLLFGMVPAAIGAPRRVSGTARDIGRSATAGRGARRTRAALVVVETALALVLLAIGAVLGRGFLELRGTPPGFETDGVLAVAMRLPPSLTPGNPRAAFFEDLRARIAPLPGVRAAGFVSSLPMAGGRDSLQFRLVDRPNAKPASANFNIASPGYFEAMRIPLRRGRTFAGGDTASAAAAIVINETAARRFWPNADPVGRQIALTGSDTTYTVIGVTADVRQADLGTAPRAEVFLCALQPGPDWNAFALVVHVDGDAARLIPDVRAALRAANGDVAVAKAGLMQEVVSGRLAEPRIYTSLLGALAALALILAAVGLYGVIGYSVTQRTREMGVRLALGSTPGALVRSVVRQGAVLTASGIALGMGGAFAATRSLTAVIPGVRPGDALTLAGAAALMLVVGLVAAYLPARRAASVDPLIALRME